MQKRRLQHLHTRQKEYQEDCMVISLLLEKEKMILEMSYLLEKGKNSNRKINAITTNKLAIWHHSAHKRSLGPHHTKRAANRNAKIGIEISKSKLQP